jgi:tetratricopeptide (TPR) repeat protein
VRDWYNADYYKTCPAANPPGPGHGKFRIIRGGGWHTGPYCSRVYIRTALQSNWVDFNVGFRCARPKGNSAALEMERIILESGIDAAKARYLEMRGTEPGEFYFDQSEFNEMGYRLLNGEKIAEAIEVLKLNAEAFPDSYNAFDSLAEAYMTLGNRELAIKSYRKSLELNPANSGGRKKLRELEEP